MDAASDVIWRFVRGDLPATEFERWLYAHGNLEATLGVPLYLELISTDFRDATAVRAARRTLDAYARSLGPLPCECISLADLAIVPMSGEPGPLDAFEQLARRGDPFWWLGLSRCTVCATPWLVAQEERHNDIFILRRLSVAQAERVLADGVWPALLDSFAGLLEIGRAAGHSVRFADPVGDSSLSWSMADIARERPGITVEELAVLLNLDAATAALIANQAVVRHRVRISVAGYGS